MKARNILLSCLLCLFSTGFINARQANNSQHQQPNIIFILVDDLGKEWVSCYGSESIETPQIDKLAASGMQFEHVYSMPQCTPTRVTFLTGQYPFRHGWINHWDVPRWGGGAHFDETVNPCLPLELKKAGYKTCIAGKWQIDDFRVEPDALERCGFDEYCMWTGYETGVPESAERYYNPYIFTKDRSNICKGDFGPDVFKNSIIDFIRQNKNQPFFIYYPMVLTHTPLVNTPGDSAKSKEEKFKSMVNYTDKITGEIMNVLEQENIRKNTVLVWTTDNGTTRGMTGVLIGQPVQGGKGKTNEAGICAPFIISWPEKIAPGQHSEALIDFSDLFPTFLDLAGVEPSKKWKTGNKRHIIDGYSFAAVLRGKSTDSERDWILGMGGGNNARLTENGVENQYVFRDRVVRNKRYKIFISPKRKVSAFYDLKADPFETKNLIDNLSPGQKANFEKLAATIKLFPVQDNDPIYKPNPPQSWDVKISAKSEEWKK